MRWLLHVIVELVRWATGARREGNGLRRGRGQDAGALERENALDGVRVRGGTRTREIYVIGPRASNDAIGWDEDRIEYVDDRNVQRIRRFKAMRLCDCGALLAFGNTLLGTCLLCGRCVCSREGCSARCSRCGALVCRRHSAKFGERVFCQRHGWYGWWLRFWVSVMKWFWLTIGLLLLFGPLRRPFFRNWRFTVPGTIGAVLGWAVTSSAMSPSDPPWMPVVVSLVVGLAAGAAGKEWLDEVFGREK